MKKLLIGIMAVGLFIGMPVIIARPALASSIFYYQQSSIANSSGSSVEMLKVYGFGDSSLSVFHDRPAQESFLVRVSANDKAPFSLSVSSGILVAVGPSVAEIYGGFGLLPPNTKVYASPLVYSTAPLQSGVSVTVPPITAHTGYGAIPIQIVSEWLWTPGPGSATLTATGQAPISIPRGVITQSSGSFSVDSVFDVYQDGNQVQVTTTGGAQISLSSDYIPIGSITTRIGWINPQPNQTVVFSSAYSGVIGGNLTLPTFTSTAPTTATVSSTPTPTVTHSVRYVKSGFPWWLLVIIVAAALAVIVLIIRYRRARAHRAVAAAGADPSDDSESGDSYGE